MTDAAVSAFRNLIDSNNVVLRDVLLVLALSGPRNISQFSDMVRAAGVRETATRAHSTTTLRPLLNDLTERGLVVQLGEFDCAPVARELSLRDAAARGVLDKLAADVRNIAYPCLRYPTQSNQAAWFDFRVTIQCRDLNAAATLFAECANNNGVRFSAHNPLVETVCEPFDPEWLRGFGERQALVLNWTLDHANRFGLATNGLCPWLYEQIDGLSGSVGLLRLLLCEAAVLRGDMHALDGLLRKMGSSSAGVEFEAARALLVGDDAAALTGFENAAEQLRLATKKKTPVNLARVCALLHGLALLRRRTVEDYARVARMAASCQRDKEYEYRASASMLKSLAEAAAAPGKAELARHLMQEVTSGDCMSLLLRGLYACWFPVPLVEREYLLMQMVPTYQKYADRGYTWLATEDLHVAQRLSKALKEAGTGNVSLRAVDRVSVPPRPQEETFGQALVELFAVKPGWQLALEQLAQTSSPEQSMADASQERLVWRVVPQFNLVEPVLQKRTGSGWTSGRKVALKQLRSDGASYATMSPHDRRVAAHVHEEPTTTWGGYTNRNYFMHPRAGRRSFGP